MFARSCFLLQVGGNDAGVHAPWARVNRCEEGRICTNWKQRSGVCTLCDLCDLWDSQPLTSSKLLTRQLPFPPPPLTNARSPMHDAGEPHAAGAPARSHTAPGAPAARPSELLHPLRSSLSSLFASDASWRSESRSALEDAIASLNPDPATATRRLNKLLSKSDRGRHGPPKPKHRKTSTAPALRLPPSRP